VSRNDGDSYFCQKCKAFTEVLWVSVGGVLIPACDRCFIEEVADDDLVAAGDSVASVVGDCDDDYIDDMDSYT